MKNALIVLSFLLVIFSCSNNKTDKHNFASLPGFEQQWFERHKDDNGKIPENILNKWQAHDIMAFKNATTRGVSPITAVQQLAPETKQGGRTRAILVDIKDTTHFLAGSVSGGLWSSNNAGQTWKAINDAAASLAVTCIVQNPIKTNEIYYGTGESRGGEGGESAGLQPLLGSGIFKSTDGGLTFNLLKSTEGVSDMTRCNYMAHSPNNDSTLYVGTANGLYLSTNSGGSWTKVLTGNSSGIICFPDGHFLASVQNGGIYNSTDGKTFTKVSNAAFPTKTGYGRVLIAHCANQPDRVYALFTDSPNGFSNYFNECNLGFYISDDGGKTWTKRADGTNAPISTTYSTYTQVLGVHPTNPDRVAIGAATITQKSLDGGKTWERFDYGHADNHTLVNIGRGDEFLLGNDGGIYKINWNGGTTLNMNNGYYTFQFYGGNFNNTGLVALGGTQDNGSWRQSPTTAASVTGGDGGYSHISQQDPNLAYTYVVGIVNGGVLGVVNRSTNFASPGFGTFAPITPSVGTEGYDFINAYEMNYADGKQLYYKSGRGLWRTKNAGNDWERMNISDILNIHAIGISNEIDPAVYVGGTQCFYRVDKGASFIPPDEFVNLRNTVPLAYRADAWGNISFHPTNKTTLLVGLTSMVARSRAIKINKANTAAPEWIEIGGDLPERLPVYQVQAHPDDPDNTFFAATAFGLYFTVNGGKNWEKETRVPNMPIYQMRMRLTDKSLFLFTHGRGAFYLNLKTLTKTAEILPENSVNIYPNPANAVVNIKAEYPLSLVQIFSADGREILTEKQNWNIPIGHLQAGMYFIKIYDNKGRFALKKFVKN